jgi:hypothetical protein
MVITGCMMTFYKTVPAVVFWQFANQTFNAVVNFSNRNGIELFLTSTHFTQIASAGVTNEQLGIAYAAASSASVATALLFNKMISSSPALSAGIVGRFVPLVAVAAANCVNIPLMRQQEIKHGIEIQTEDGQVAGESTKAAVNAISQVSQTSLLLFHMFLSGYSFSNWNGNPRNGDSSSCHVASREDSDSH